MTRKMRPRVVTNRSLPLLNANEDSGDSALSGAGYCTDGLLLPDLSSVDAFGRAISMMPLTRRPCANRDSYGTQSSGPPRPAWMLLPVCDIAGKMRFPAC